MCLLKSNFIKSYVLLLASIATSCNDSHKEDTNETTSEASAIAAIDVKLDQLRHVINDEKLDYAVDITSVAGKTIDEITGEKELTKAENDSIQKLLKRNNDLDKDAGPSGYIVVGGKQLLPTMSKLDLRDYGLITKVKDQNPAGSCWAFGALATFESNYDVINKLDIDGSEQYVINCSGAGTANKGGLAFQVFQWMVEKNRNVDDESNTPYQAADLPCSPVSPQTNYYAVEWQFINPDQDPSAIPTVRQIKDAICRYGAVSASVYVTEAFQYYKFRPSEPNRTYVFKENGNFPGTNHAIALIGWDDSKNAWILKNSWGKKWGITCNTLGESGYKEDNSGYMWIDYNSNNVGRRALWAKAKKVK